MEEKPSLRRKRKESAVGAHALMAANQKREDLLNCANQSVQIKPTAHKESVPFRRQALLADTWSRTFSSPCPNRCIERAGILLPAISIAITFS
jgi:hypothetical protein